MEKTNKKGFLAWFTDNWKRKPLFSTGIALLVMVILQILALGFDYASFGEWFAAFSRNWINILRNNAGVGIIALGMTFVIISGGIDLAVGSTMVAIGAVIMSLIDSGPSGLLARLGITRAEILTNGCENVAVGAWILARKLRGHQVPQQAFAHPRAF